MISLCYSSSVEEEEEVVDDRDDGDDDGATEVQTILRSVTQIRDTRAIENTTTIVFIMIQGVIGPSNSRSCYVQTSRCKKNYVIR